MVKKILSLAFIALVSSSVFASSSDDVKKHFIAQELSKRLVDDKGNVTGVVEGILSATGVQASDDTLPAVVKAVQEAWRKNDWKFPKTLDNVKKREALEENLSSLRVIRAGEVVSSVVTQGGGFCTTLQILAGLNKVALNHKLNRVTCFVPGFPLDENGIEDYEALLEIVGEKAKHAEELRQEVEAKTLDRKTLLAWVQKHVYPVLSNVPIDLLSAREMSEWAKKHPGDVTLVAPTNQAANHCASIRARCPELNIVGMRAISKPAAGVFDKFYRRAQTEDQKLGAQLNILAGELYWLNKVLNQQKEQDLNK